MHRVQVVGHDSFRLDFVQSYAWMVKLINGLDEFNLPARDYHFAELKALLQGSVDVILITCGSVTEIVSPGGSISLEEEKLYVVKQTAQVPSMTVESPFRTSLVDRPSLYSNAGNAGYQPKSLHNEGELPSTSYVGPTAQFRPMSCDRPSYSPYVPNKVRCALGAPPGMSKNAWKRSQSIIIQPGEYTTGYRGKITFRRKVTAPVVVVEFRNAQDLTVFGLLREVEGQLNISTEDYLLTLSSGCEILPGTDISGIIGANRAGAKAQIYYAQKPVYTEEVDQAFDDVNDDDIQFVSSTSEVNRPDVVLIESNDAEIQTEALTSKSVLLFLNCAVCLKSLKEGGLCCSTPECSRSVCLQCHNHYTSMTSPLCPFCRIAYNYNTIAFPRID